MNCLKNMERITIPADQVLDMIKLYKFNGKEFYYKDVFKQDLNQISKDIIEKETYFLAKIADVKLTEARLRILSKKKIVPKNKEELFVLNIKTVIEMLHNKIDDFEPIVNDCFQMIKILYKNVMDISFVSETITDRSRIVPERVKKSKRDDFEKLLQTVETMRKSNDYELTLLITNFFVDFINIGPYTSNNNFIGYLYLYTLLFYYDFKQFKFASFFEKVYKDQKFFETAILQANFNWAEGFSQTATLHKQIIKMMLENYKEIEQKLRDYEFEKGLNKTDDVENTIIHLNEIFTKADIRAIHPYVSDSTIDRTLIRLRDEDKIRPLGTGRSAKWLRVYKPDSRFNPEQLSLFGNNEE